MIVPRIFLGRGIWHNMASVNLSASRPQNSQPTRESRHMSPVIIAQKVNKMAKQAKKVKKIRKAVKKVN